MKRTDIHKSDEPWRKNEPGARLTKKAHSLQDKSQREREAMENQSTQTIIIYPRKVGFGLIIPKRWKTFTVVCKPPILKEDFYERMQKAFPDCIWKGEQ